MSLLHFGKDGGPKSTVTGYWFPEIKRLFSIALLKFENGSRDEFHSHAFNCISWVLKGKLREERLDEGWTCTHTPSLWPIVTKRSTFHRVFSRGTTWVFTIRGPWGKTWMEYNPQSSQFSLLGLGRKVLQVWP